MISRVCIIKQNLINYKQFTNTLILLFLIFKIKRTTFSMISANLNNAGHGMLINTVSVNNGQTTAADTYQLLSQKDTTLV